MKLFVALSTLCAAALLLLVPEASAAPQPASGIKTDSYKQSAKATVDFIAHEQASGQAEAASPPPQPRPVPTPLPPRQSGDTQQHQNPNYQHQQRQNASTAPKRDWELVPPSTRHTPTVRPPTYTRPTPPTYAGVVKNRQEVVLPTLPPLTTQRPRVYNVPIVVEDRGNYTTTTENSRWYDKLFGRGTDVDDSPWGRRRRQATTQVEGRRGEEREEVVIGSNAIRVSGSRPQQSGQSRPRPSRQ